VVPRTKGDGLKGFFWPRTKYHDDAHATNVAAAIREELRR
jgi:histidine triad (HIT) family protein